MSNGVTTKGSTKWSVGVKYVQDMVRERKNRWHYEGRFVNNNGRSGRRLVFGAVDDRGRGRASGSGRKRPIMPRRSDPPPFSYFPDALFRSRVRPAGDRKGRKKKFVHDLWPKLIWRLQFFRAETEHITHAHVVRLIIINIVELCDFARRCTKLAVRSVYGVAARWSGRTM